MSLFRRLCALGAVTSLSLAGLTGLAAPANAATDARPATIGAEWLAGQLTDGLLPGDFGPLYGPSIDAGLSLQVVGGQATAVSDIRTALGAAIQDDDYITGEGFGDTGSTYAGAVAKSLVFAEETGAGSTSLGGKDLQTRLEAQVISTAPNAGRLFDTSGFGDFSNTLGQAFAARGLSAASSTKADDVVSFLLLQQCSDGYFRQDFADDSDTDQSCDAGIDAGDSAPSVDTTAIATQQLEAIESPSLAVTTAISHATDWLLTQQHPDGSFSADQLLGPNSDTTGVAGIVLDAAGETTAAARAATWVKAHQADEPVGCPNALTGETGAVGYDDDALAAGRADGIGGGQQWRIATAQALPVLQLVPAGTSHVAVSGPDGYVAAGSTASYRFSGGVPGDKVCTVVFGVHRTAVVPVSGASFVLTGKAPAGTATRTASITDPDGNTASTVTSVLGAKQLTVKPGKDRVHRGARLRVVVRGLAPGERVTLRFRGHTVRTGLADPDGRFVRHFRVGHKLGKARVVAWGEFPALRHGRAVVRVVR